MYESESITPRWLFGLFGAYASFTEELEDLTHHLVSPIHALVWYTQ